MAEYDGEVKLGVGLEAKDVKKSAQDISNTIKNVFDKANSADNLDPGVQKLLSNMSKVATKTDLVMAKMKSLENTKLPSDEYKKLERELASVEKQYERLNQKRFQAESKIRASKQFANVEEAQRRLDSLIQSGQTGALKIQAELDLKDAEKELDRFQKQTGHLDLVMKTDALEEQMDAIKDDMTALVDAGKAFTFGQDTSGYNTLKNQLSDLNNEQAMLIDKAKEFGLIEQQVESTSDAISGESKSAKDAGKSMDDLASNKKKATKENKRLGDEGKKTTKSLNSEGSAVRKLGEAIKRHFSKTHNHVDRSNFSFGRLFKTLLAYGLGMRGLMALFNKLRGAIREGITNMAQWNGGMNGANSAISQLLSSLNYLKNAWGAAFAPILEFVAPVLSRLIDMLAQAANYIGAFFAAITGKSSFVKAKKVMTNYAQSLQSATKAAKDEKKAEEELQDELEEKLGSYDKLEVIQQDKDKDNDKAKDELDDLIGGGAVDPFAEMFEEIPIPDWIKKLKDFFDQIWDVFRKAWENKGQGVIDAWKRALDNIKTLIGDIGRTWFEVWTNGTGQRWVESLLTLLTTILNIIGSIAEALDKAWNRDQNGFKWITSIYEMFTSINLLLAAIGDSIDKVFRSEVGVSIFEHILHIFTNINDTIKNLADRFREAWEEGGKGDDIVMTIAEILDDVLETLDNITKKTAEWAEKLNFNPILESIRNLLKSIREFLQPIFDGLEFVWTNILLPLGKWTIEDAVPRFFEVLGAVFKLIAPILDGIVTGLKSIWNNFLQPMLSAAWQDVKPIIDDIIGMLKGLGENKVVQDGLQLVGKFLSVIIAAPIMTAVTALRLLAAAAKLVSEKIEELIDFLSQEFAEPIENFKQFGKDLIDGLTKGIDEFLADPLAWVKEHIFDPIVNKFKEIFKINSPSKVFEEFGGGFIEGLQNGISNAWEAFTSFFSGLLEGLKLIVDTAWEGIKTAAGTAWDTATGVGSVILEKFGEAKGKAEEIANNIKERLDSAWGTIKTTAGKAWGNVRSSVSDKFGEAKDKAIEFGGNIKDKLVENWETLKTNTGTAWDNVKKSIIDKFSNTQKETTGTAGKIRTGINREWEQTNRAAQTKWKEMHTTIDTQFKQTQTDTKTTGNRIKDDMGEAWGATSRDTTTKWGEIHKTVNDKANSMKSDLDKKDFNGTGKGMMDKLSSGINKGLSSGVVSAINKVISSITNPFKNIANSFENVGQNICTGILNGLYRGWRWLQDSVYNLARSLYNSACSALGIYSPSREFAKIGRFVDLGLIEGLEDEEKSVEKQLENIATLMTGSFKEAALNIPNVVTGKITPNTAAFTQAVSTARTTDTTSTNASDNQQDHPPIVLQLDGRTVAQVVWDNEQKRYKQTGNNRFAFGMG